ncbi:uncharacterized protein OCT59_014037 [Rhizophagus irregularis]|uniref:Uncharacterized protein n=2 Tax=Rhizophagus irregularis TaxID=588596 RepID=U9TL78_RHIID|nr:hypothetical protein GLOIN_2v1474275 [Rhizophagus irregularis DAOM 181602=DAOM 197198]EXX75005.1 hypothetical protein RirG_045750 [Rhizophagus irregularis DAOM 197198w]UZO21650.1 hypothetical protein OCT59_014037 [Rhizophagus irregularis]POG76785.1 hypothetical protein GLOIN_2v1474275 [Rhizophagus irregularis DAOM 181602=DAOM 197198]CAG8467608.1 19864_t:CDS:1 [Rhizophagus irregularis]GBC23040.1 hypothetical protein GLOIN_2v1474275 [Rhizophagus irregularis DAOM 181602=DAOM 197198]|eukprot:XP_025183651.1 hypothetical protein GLOIN_2v1474275 [Rhizophagus irregularis DAOM 181602=DAOM 197198]
MEIVDNHYNKLHTLESRNLSLNKSLTIKKQILNDIVKDFNEKKGAWLKQKGEVKDVSKHLFHIIEQKDEVLNDTFTLTEEVLNLLGRKEIFHYKDKVSDFNVEVEQRLGSVCWNKIMSIFNRKLNTEQVIRKEDEKFLTELKKVLNSVNMTTNEFELLFRIKRNSNNKFHQDEMKTLD